MASTFRGEDLEGIIVHFQDGHVQRSTTKIEDQDATFDGLSVRIIHGSGSRLVH